MDTECRTLFNDTRHILKEVIGRETKDLCADVNVIVAEEGELTEATRFPETANTLLNKVEPVEKLLESALAIFKRLRSTPTP